MIDPPLPAAHCDLCGDALAPYFTGVVDPQSGEEFSIERCGRCGLGHTLPQPADLTPYYGSAYHGGRHGVTDRLCMARRLGFVNRVAPPGRLLDFGCGDGGFLAAAAAVGWQGVGVEMKPEHARARGLEIFERVEEVEGNFDVITLWHSLEHMRSPRVTLETLAPCLAPGGHLVIAVPNWSSLQASVFGRRWFHVDVPRHLFHFSPTALDQMLARQGFTAVRRWNLEFEIDLFGWTQSLLNLVLPHPNVLFDTLTRRGRAHGGGEIAASIALGTLASVAALPLTPLAAAAGRGAIMIVAAERRPTVAA